MPSLPELFVQSKAETTYALNKLRAGPNGRRGVLSPPSNGGSTVACQVERDGMCHLVGRAVIDTVVVPHGPIVADRKQLV